MFGREWCEKWLLWTPWKAKITKMKQNFILPALQHYWQHLAHSNSPSKDFMKCLLQVHHQNRWHSLLASIFKEIWLVKLDFSSTNYKAKVIRWHPPIKKKANTLFPVVCNCACMITSVAAATAMDSTQSEYQDPEILAQANLESKSKSKDKEDTTAEHQEEDTKRGTADDTHYAAHMVGRSSHISYT